MADEQHTVVIELDEKCAEALSYQISDWMCWVAGLKVGIKIGDEYNSDFIPGVDHIRELNIKIKDKLK